MASRFATRVFLFSVLLTHCADAESGGGGAEGPEG